MIAFLDWGIGGLGCLRALRACEPNARILYFSDAGFTPYGRVPAVQLAERVLRVASWLRARDVTQLVVACNAASTVLPRLGIAHGVGTLHTPTGALEVTGIISHGVALAQHSGARRIGVIGGARTIRSNVYGLPLRAAGQRVTQRIAQPLSARVEAGELDSPALQREVERIVRPLRQVDALLLACTHYPALAPLLSRVLPCVQLLDPAESLARFVHTRWLAPTLAVRPARPVSPTHDLFVTTGEPGAMQLAAARAFAIQLAAVESVAVG